MIEARNSGWLAPISFCNFSALARPRCLHREVKFVLGSVKVFLCLSAMPLHVEVVGGTRPIHLVNGLDYVLVNFVKIVPVTNLRGNHRAGHEGQ